MLSPDSAHGPHLTPGPASTSPDAGGQAHLAKEGRTSPPTHRSAPHPSSLFPETEDSCYASGGMALCSLGDFTVN